MTSPFCLVSEFVGAVSFLQLGMLFPCIGQCMQVPGAIPFLLTIWLTRINLGLQRTTNEALAIVVRLNV